MKTLGKERKGKERKGKETRQEISKIVEPQHRVNTVKPILQSVTAHQQPVLSFRVSDAQQQQELASLRGTVPHGHFFFVLNFLERKLEHIHGIERHLGYQNLSFDLQKYLSLIHPSQFETINILAQRVIEIVNQPQYQLNFRGDRYSFDVALKHAAGYWVLCRCTLSCWQYALLNDKEAVTAYLSEFYVNRIDVAENQLWGRGISPTAYDINYKKLDVLLEVMRTNTATKMEDLLIEKDGKTISLFTTQEFRIIRKVANVPTISHAELATSFVITERTFDTHRTNLLRKATAFFGTKFDTLRALAEFMRREYLV